jgi:hypothetical protein
MEKDYVIIENEKCDCGINDKCHITGTLKSNKCTDTQLINAGIPVLYRSKNDIKKSDKVVRIIAITSARALVFLIALGVIIMLVFIILYMGIIMFKQIQSL